MLVTLREILPDAKKNRYAVGLFNTVDLEMAKGVLAAGGRGAIPGYYRFRRGAAALYRA